MQCKDLSKPEDARQVQGAILTKPEQEGGEGRQRGDMWVLGHKHIAQTCARKVFFGHLF